MVQPPRVFVFAVLLSGCVIVDDPKPNDGPDAAESASTSWSNVGDDNAENTDAVNVTVTVDWGDTQFTMAVAPSGAYQLGMAETGGSCGDSVSCWTGEDCFDGFSTPDGTLLGPWCHAVTDGAVSLEYGGDYTDLAAGTTVFQPAFAGTVTYVLLPEGSTRGTEPCWVFGHDPDYYADLGCTVLVP